jgi:hypothetical protein
VAGRNLRIDLRFAAGDLDRIRAYTAELVGLAPEVIVTNFATATVAVQQQTKTIPIVFAAGGDPVVGGIVRNIARPEGNSTGFGNYQPSIARKWLELLKRRTQCSQTRYPDPKTSPLHESGASPIIKDHANPARIRSPAGKQWDRYIQTKGECYEKIHGLVHGFGS